MKNRVQAAAGLPLLLLMSGCAFENERLQIMQDQDRFMAEQPALNGANFGNVVFIVALATVLIIAVLAFSFAYVRAAKHEAGARVATAREKTRQAEIAAGHVKDTS